MFRHQQGALFALIEEGNLEGLRETFLVQESNGLSLAAILSSRDKGGMAPFLAACEYGHLEIAVFLLDKGSSIYEKDYHGRTPLHLASQHGHLNIFNRLVKLGSSVNEKDYHGWTPLHYACQGGHLNVINRLVELGASVNERANDGWTPLHYACLRSHKSVIMFLLRHNALTTVHPEDSAIYLFFSSRDSMLAVFAYGFNQHVSDDDYRRLADDEQVLYRVVCDMCSLQVIFHNLNNPLERVSEH
jgi:ankyrin repeat protein